MKRWFLLLFLALSSALYGYEFLILGDTHYDSPEVRVLNKKLKPGRAKEYKRNLNCWSKNMPSLLEAAGERAAGQVDFVVQLGDLTQGDCGAQKLQEKSFRNAVSTIRKAVKVPFYAVKGNHDIRGKGAQEAYINVMIPYLEKALKTPPAVKDTGHFVLKHKKDLFIFFDSIKPDLAYVEKAFAENPDVRYVFFMTHLPLLPCAGGDPSWIVFGSPKQNAERQKLLSLLAKHNAIVLTAHIHRASLFRYQSQEGTITQLTTFSMVTDSEKTFAVEEFNPNDYFQSKNYRKALQEKETIAEVMRDFEGKYITRWEMSPDAGFNVLRVTDEGVSVDLYIGVSKKVTRTIPLLPLK